ncbi:Hypothetical protein ORPV_958 [Orpheovirus IHUMI-LCC2]|uniref:Uncharacterized protein n=1 Tax=Orpheovirus IHUMI-LCC2 TaxID=2023057 RepID=A0A2I2L5N8_9VIRU|nr:Hypothetical protein ORPV_958 [Orpheovirus IHUMI-LCC2]SNW62862.1 Hypothetical protein ORPV_958 [Orpheovirus IHUMI-LCC2]
MNIILKDRLATSCSNVYIQYNLNSNDKRSVISTDVIIYEDIKRIIDRMNVKVDVGSDVLVSLDNNLNYVLNYNICSDNVNVEEVALYIMNNGILNYKAGIIDDISNYAVYNVDYRNKVMESKRDIENEMRNRVGLTVSAYNDVNNRTIHPQPNAVYDTNAKNRSYQGLNNFNMILQSVKDKI